MNKEQKFKKGDLVRVAKDLGQIMSHFTSDCDAIVIGSYKDQYGGNDIDSFTIYIKGQGETSWYYGSQLTFIESGQLDKLQSWKDEAAAEEKEKSDLDWIFANGADVLNRPHGSSIEALAKCFGMINLWWANGEGFVYQANTMGTLKAAEPYLKSGDKEGWLKFCDALKKTKVSE